jgi:hypothetical protein
VRNLPARQAEDLAGDSVVVLMASPKGVPRKNKPHSDVEVGVRRQACAQRDFEARGSSE